MLNIVYSFTVKYRETIDPEAHLWERCASVLSRRDIVRKLSEPCHNFLRQFYSVTACRPDNNTDRDGGKRPDLRRD